MRLPGTVPPPPLLRHVTSKSLIVKLGKILERPRKLDLEKNLGITKVFARSIQEFEGANIS